MINDGCLREVENYYHCEACEEERLPSPTKGFKLYVIWVYFQMFGEMKNFGSWVAVSIEVAMFAQKYFGTNFDLTCSRLEIKQSV